MNTSQTSSQDAHELAEFLNRLKRLHEATAELALATTFDELCRQAVELGRDKLGFDRLGLWFYDDDPAYLVGSFGTDESGQVRDERGQRVPAEFGFDKMREVLKDRVFTSIQPRNPLRNHLGEVIGYGWNLMATVRVRNQVIGWLAGDNFLQRKPLLDYEPELLSLYADALGHLAAACKAQEALAAERTMLRTIIDAVPDFIFVKDLQARFTLVNRASWEDLHQYKGERDFIGRTDFDFCPPELAERYRRDDVYVMQTGQSIYNQEEPGFSVNADRILLTTKVPLRDHRGEITGVVGITRDVTEIKAAQQQHTALMVERERIKTLRELLSSLSHDLRTPLSVINSSLYLLERLNDPEKQRDKLDTIKQQTALLERFINDILMISRLDNETVFQKRLVSLHHLILEVARTFEPLAEEHGLRLEISLSDSDSMTLGDEGQLHRALSNLVQNAVHYTPEGGRIYLRGFEHEGWSVLEVEDTGIGIDADELPRIFDHFYRVDKARSMDKGGTGLGLAIVRRIVQMHGGEVQVESVPDQGSVFRVLLPLERSGEYRDESAG
jgi:two-component system, OmpR family, phosphate regulon sensor histidine kinase PhoR